jgi:hypothetical protein
MVFSSAGKEIHIPSVLSQHENAVLRSERDYVVLNANPRQLPGSSGTAKIQEAYIYSQSRAQQRPPGDQVQHSVQCVVPCLCSVLLLA